MSTLTPSRLVTRQRAAPAILINGPHGRLAPREARVGNEIGHPEHLIPV